MCDACIINEVKARMVSRRTLFKRAAAAAAVTSVGAGIGTPALAAGHDKVLDMTHELHEGFPTFFGEQQFFMDPRFTFAEHKFNLFDLRINEHTGTHLDAPLHFTEDGMSVAEIPVASLVVPLCVVDIRAKAADNADAQLTPEDVQSWIDVNGPIPANACVAMLSGWDQHLGSDKFRNADDQKLLHFPGFHVEAVQFLAEETGTAGIAVDTLSLDYGMSPDFATHYAWLASGRWGLECIANLESVPAKGATLVVGAPKHRGGTGGPSRVFALI